MTGQLPAAAHVIIVHQISGNEGPRHSTLFCEQSFKNTSVRGRRDEAAEATLKRKVEHTEKWKDEVS